MMTVEQEHEAALAEGLIEPRLIERGDPRILINGLPTRAAMRLISEGQYQAMLAVWIKAGYSILPERRSSVR